jgi:hypothetical protein
MQVWLISFVVLFALYECWDWFSRLELPLPIFVVGGLFLAIVSNYDKRGLFPGWPADSRPMGEATDEITEPTPEVPRPIPASEIPPLDSPAATGIRSPRLPFE